MRYILIGDSGHAKVIADIIMANGDTVLAKLDDKHEHLMQVNEIFKGPVSSVNEMLTDDVKVIIAIGNNKVRERLVQHLQLKDDQYGIAIHPSAVVSPSANISHGTVVMPNAVINADAKIGQHTIINTLSVVEHDCIVESFVHIAPCAVVAGGAKVRTGAHIGPNATVDVLAKVSAWETVKAGQIFYK